MNNKIFVLALISTTLMSLSCFAQQSRYVMSCEVYAVKEKQGGGRQVVLMPGSKKSKGLLANQAGVDLQTSFEAQNGETVLVYATGSVTQIPDRVEIASLFQTISFQAHAKKRGDYEKGVQRIADAPKPGSKPGVLRDISTTIFVDQDMYQAVCSINK